MYPFTQNLSHLIHEPAFQTWSFFFQNTLSQNIGRLYLTIYIHKGANSLIYLLGRQKNFSISSRPEVLYEKSILENFVKLTLVPVSFLIRLQAQACTLLRRDSGTSVSLFTEHLWRLLLDFKALLAKS